MSGDRVADAGATGSGNALTIVTATKPFKKAKPLESPAHGHLQNKNTSWSTVLKHSVGLQKQTISIDISKISTALDCLRIAKSAAAKADFRRAWAKTINTTAMRVAANFLAGDNETIVKFLLMMEKFSFKEFNAAETNQRKQHQRLDEAHKVFNQEIERYSRPGLFPNTYNRDDLMQVAKNIIDSSKSDEERQDIDDALNSANLHEAIAELIACSKIIKAQHGKLSPEQEKEKQAIINYAVDWVIKPRARDGSTADEVMVNQFARLDKLDKLVRRKKDVDLDLFGEVVRKCADEMHIPKVHLSAFGAAFNVVLK